MQKTQLAPFDNLADHVPREWILGHAIGVLGYALTQFNPSPTRAGRDRTERKVKRLFSLLAQFQRMAPKTTLPASTLSVLSRPELMRAVAADRRPSLSNWARYDEVSTGRWDFDEKTPRPSPLNAAKLVAHQILYSDASVRAIADALIAFLSDGYGALRQTNADQAAIAQQLRTLRQPSQPTSELLDAAGQVTAILLKYSSSAPLVRNALLDQLLAWPLLVFGDTRADRVIGAISVPIAVELNFDGDSKVSAAFADSGKDQSLEGWMGHLRHSAEIGKALWRSKNGNKGTWRDQVMAASTVYDFTLAERIMHEAGLAPDFEDRSMEAYFAQVVLAKAIGRHAGFTAAITGQIGAQRAAPIVATALPSLAPARVEADAATSASAPSSEPEPEVNMSPLAEGAFVLDWRLELPGYVGKKAGYVYDSHKYDRYVLAPVGRGGLDARESNSYVETNHCRYLSDVADCVQLGGWRQFTYIRSNDVAHAVHRRPEELPPVDSVGVTRCLSLLAASTGPILRLPVDIRPSDLFSALFHLNYIRRLADAFPAPSMSWTALRTTDDKSDVRLWHLLFRRVFHAQQAEFHKLQLSETSQEAAAIIANALNNLVPDERSRAETAPDLLIFMGNEHIETEVDEEILSFLRPLSFQGVLEALEEQPIRPVSNELNRKLIGATRIILIGKDDHVGAASSRHRLEFEEAEDVMSRLRTFRFGFTQQMASITLHHLFSEPQIIRRLLKNLVVQGRLTYVNGWYWLRSGSPERALRPLTDRQLARDHFYAGVAFAPYLARHPVPGLNLSQALLPDHVHEAAWHFEEAAAAASRNLGSSDADPALVGIRDQARLAQQRIMRFFDIPTWEIVHRLSRQRKGTPYLDTYAIGTELLRFWDAAGKTPKSAAISTVATAGARLWQAQTKDGQADPTELASLFEEVCDLYERAHLEARQSAQFPREQKLSVATRYGAFLRRFGKTEDLRRRCGEFDGEILAALADGVEGHGLGGEWFELYGDTLESDSEAAKMYFHGADRVPKYYNNLVKYSGSSLRSGADPREVLESLRMPGNLDLESLLSWLSRIYPSKQNQLKKKWVVPRVTAGTALLMRLHPAQASSMQPETTVASR